MTLGDVTIIPAHHYVRRNADRQLKQVIQEMGRPAYLLVARQMGKTNLLLNCKRENENEKDKYIYFDLSSPSDSAQQYFRNIIDVILEMYPVHFSKTKDEVNERRKANSLPPQKEHEGELRLLLNAGDGKIIIILDEVDALTKSEYSDQIFAQIRSIYFMRVNYPEYSRLTYILSGVADPIQLIKDKRISPFNIGAKIFLDDFSPEETNEFIRLANLKISNEATSRLRAWVSGNPRMTWDVCAECEKTNRDILPEDIDLAVNVLYLQDYNRAPIDHIRQLASGDAGIRDAIVALHYRKGRFLSDEIKNKLYLSGVIGSDFSDPQFKNKIIEQSLSLQWLSELEKKEKGLLILARDRQIQGLHADAIVYYENYLAEKGDFPNEQKNTLYYLLGKCYASARRYKDAIEYLLKAKLDQEKDRDIFFDCLYKIGQCYLRIEKWSDSIEWFDAILNDKVFQELSNGDAYNHIRLAIILNKANALSCIDFIKYNVDIVNSYQLILEETLNHEKSDGEYSKLRSTSSYNLASAYVALNKKEKAIPVLAHSLLTCIPSEKPAILLAYSKIEEDQFALISTIINVAKDIIDNKITPNRTEEEGPLDFTESRLDDILLLCYRTARDQFVSLSDYWSTTDAQNLVSNKGQMYTRLGIKACENRDPESGLALLEDSIRRLPADWSQNIDQRRNAATAFRYISAIDPDRSRQYLHLEETYLALLYSGEIPTADLADVRYLGARISNNRANNNRADIKRDCRGALAIIDRLGPSYAVNKILFQYFLIEEAELENDFGGKRLLANQISDTYKTAGAAKDNKQFISENDVSYIRSRIGSILAKIPSQKAEFRLLGRKLGRNDYVTVEYANGRKITEKLKKIEHDLMANKCKIINNNTN